MIVKGSCLRVIDNSGALMVRCIRVNKGKRFASISDDIVAVVIKASSSSKKIKKSEIVRAVIVTVAQPYVRADGSSVKCDKSCVVLVDKSLTDLVGTRVLAPVQRELKDKYPKMLSLAPEVL